MTRRRLHIPSETNENYEVQSEKLSQSQQHNAKEDNDNLSKVANINTLKVSYTNSDGLLNKMQELRISLNSTNRPDVIAVTECKPKHLEDPVLESEFNLEGYTSYCQGLDGKNNRGLLLYVNSNIVASVVDIPVAFQESIFVMLKDRKNINKLSIGDINRNPKSCRENDNS